jgi:hypothetical protein
MGIVLGIILVFFVLRFIININKRVTVSQSFNHSNFNISIDDSILTTINYNGTEIRSGYYYLAVLVNVTNKSNSSKVLDTDNFWLDIDNKYYYPILDKSSNFIDLGEPYYGGKIPKGETHKYVLVYELPTKLIRNKYEIKIINSITYKDGVADPTYNKIKLKPKVYKTVESVEYYNISDLVSLSDTKLLNTSLMINNYSLSNKYLYEFSYCYLDNCSNKKNSITPSNNKTLLVLDDNLIFDDNSNYKTYKKGSNFFEDFATIQYEYSNDSTVYYSNIVDKTPTDAVNEVNHILEVDYNVQYANKINMVITIRNRKYVIKIK